MSATSAADTCLTGSYGGPFLRAHSDALLASGHARWDAAEALTKRPEFKRAHPTTEHFLPALVALGAADDAEPTKELLFIDEGALGWAMVSGSNAARRDRSR